MLLRKRIVKPTNSKRKKVYNNILNAHKNKNKFYSQHFFR